MMAGEHSIRCVGYRPGCRGVGGTRGLCQGCYSSASKAVAAGKVSWTQLEDEGRALPAKPPSWKRRVFAQQGGNKFPVRRSEGEGER